MTKEEQLNLLNNMIEETVGDIMKNLFETVEKMEDAGLTPSMGFDLIRSAGFAVLGSSLMFFRTDEDRLNAGQELVNDFGKYLAKSIEANKGMGNAQKSSIILQ